MKRFFSVVAKPSAPQPVEDSKKICIVSTSHIEMKKTSISPEKQASPMKELGVAVHRTFHTKTGGKIKLAEGSIVDFEGDCIVNAANVYGLGGGGVDGAINEAGGSELKSAREKIPIVFGTNGVRIPTGQARCTRAFGRLKCKHVVHAVGPNYSYSTSSREVNNQRLSRAYHVSLLEGRKVQAKTVAFSLLSAGVYRGEESLESVLRIGFETLKDNLQSGEVVYLVAFSDSERQVLDTIFTTIG